MYASNFLTMRKPFIPNFVASPYNGKERDVVFKTLNLQETTFNHCLPKDADVVEGLH